MPPLIPASSSDLSPLHGGCQSLSSLQSVTVLLVCPGWPPDVSVCWAHGLLFVPCAPLSIVCPLPSCYLIIVSVAPHVSPSFVSLFILLVSVVLCWSVVFRRVCIMLTATVLCLPACFPLRGGFCSFLFHFMMKKEPFSCTWVLASSLFSCTLTQSLNNYLGESCI